MEGSVPGNEGNPQSLDADMGTKGSVEIVGYIGSKSGLDYRQGQNNGSQNTDQQDSKQCSNQYFS